MRGDQVLSHPARYLDDSFSGGVGLLAPEPARGTDSMHSIDAFFRALAEDCGPRGRACSQVGPGRLAGCVTSSEAGGSSCSRKRRTRGWNGGSGGDRLGALARRDPAGFSPIIARKQSTVIATSKRDPSSEHATSEQGFDGAVSSGQARCAARAAAVGRPGDRAELDESLESLLASLSDAVYFKDASGKFLRANRPWPTAWAWC